MGEYAIITLRFLCRSLQFGDNLKHSFTSHLFPLKLTLGAEGLIRRVELSVSTRSRRVGFDLVARLSSVLDISTG